MSRLLRAIPVLALAAVLAICIFAGCSQGTAASADGRPTILRFAYVQSEDELQQTASLRTELLRRYLESALHIPVQMTKLGSYAPTIEAMRTDKVDVASFGSFGYLIASEKAGAEAIVTRGTQENGHGTYRSVIAVPSDSPLHSINDLKAHAKAVVFAFTDPASTSGHLVPRAYLESIGIDPERDFKKVVFVGSHMVGALSIKAGNVDAGSVDEMVITRLAKLGRLSQSDLRILWRSEPIPDGPIAVRKALPQALKEQIRAAYIAIPQKDPELWKSLTASYGTSNMTYVPANDQMYDGLRKLARNVPNIQLLDK